MTEESVDERPGGTWPALLPGHVPALDGIRGIAILLVLLVHLTPWKTPYHGWREAILSVADVGWIGVDLFFVLSAFLITNILIDTRGHAHYFRDFYVRRALRIFPLYYLTIAVECLLLPLLLGPGNAATQAALAKQWALWTYTANWVPDVYRGAWLSLGHMWSLSMEEQFYLLWAVIVALTPLRRLSSVLAVMGGSILLLQSWWFLSGEAIRLGPFLLMPETLSHFDGFIAGSWIATALRSPSGAARLRRVLPWTTAIVGLAIAESIRRHLLSAAVEDQLTDAHRWTKALAFPSLAIFFACLVALAVLPEGRLWQRAVSVRPLQFLGKYSYGIYVFHGVLLPFFEWAIPRELAFAVGGNGNRASMFYFVVASLISIAIAVLSYRLIESPFLRLKRFFGGTRPQSPALDGGQVPSSLSS